MSFDTLIPGCTRLSFLPPKKLLSHVPPGRAKRTIDLRSRSKRCFKNLLRTRVTRLARASSSTLSGATIGARRRWRHWATFVTPMTSAAHRLVPARHSRALFCRWLSFGAKASRLRHGVTVWDARTPPSVREGPDLLGQGIVLADAKTAQPSPRILVSNLAVVGVLNAFGSFARAQQGFLLDNEIAMPMLVRWGISSIESQCA